MPVMASRSSRSRIVVWLSALVAVSLLAIILTTRTVLLNQVPQDANDEVEQELEEFAAFAAEGVDPTTTKPFASSERLVKVYIAREAPSADEALVGLVDHQVTYVSRYSSRELSTHEGLLNEVRESPRNSGIYTPESGDPIHWGRVEVAGNDGQEVGFLVARFTEADYAAVSELMRTLTLVSLAVLAFSIVLAWVMSGRLTSPIRRVAHSVAADAKNETTTMVEISGTDEISELARAYQDNWLRLRASGKIGQSIAGSASRQITAAIAPDRSPEQSRQELLATADSLDALAELTPGFLGTARTPVHPQVVLRHAAEHSRQVLDGVSVSIDATATNVVNVNPSQISRALVQAAWLLSDYGATELHLRSTIAADTMLFAVYSPEVELSASQAESLLTWPVPNQPGSDGPSTFGAVVRATADAHVGSASVSSAAGCGTTVALILPQEVTEDDDDSDEEH